MHPIHYIFCELFLVPARGYAAKLWYELININQIIYIYTYIYIQIIPYIINYV